MQDQFDIQRQLDHAGEAELKVLMDKLADDKDDNERVHRDRMAHGAKENSTLPPALPLPRDKA